MNNIILKVKYKKIINIQNSTFSKEMLENLLINFLEFQNKKLNTHKNHRKIRYYNQIYCYKLNYEKYLIKQSVPNNKSHYGYIKIFKII